MPLHTFHLPEHIWNASFDVPVRLRSILEESIARDEQWACHLYHRPGSEVWTLITFVDAEVYQWRNNELFRGTWVPDREAMRYDEGRFSGLYNLEGRKIPSDAADDEELGGDAYKPAFGIRDAPDEPEF